MPQLNPTPWFTIMLFAWFLFLTVIPPKILAHISPNDPLLREVNNSKTESWAWTWY
uniref:ATP synthase complex subunit 8 n=1 Tax=Nothobranchius vosseleri TaxID=2565562 RepID=A0A517Y3Q2_9TELE|nr:ATP synthase F0 subunit 8 [Nothobranchius vosseleri]QDU24402.1 ATP synthase F0 subunit 8 [Nothobranchius vosseleri]